MAILEQFEFENAFTYRRCTIPLHQQGFVYIRGENGVGKSTPWDVMQHTFYGTTSRGLRKRGIICTIPREDTSDELGFMSSIILRNEAGNHVGRWMIRESRDHSEYDTAVKIFKEVDGKWSEKWKGGGCPKRLEDAQKFGAELLGLKQNEFEGCMYLSQNGTHTLIEGKPSEKMRYLAYLFGVDRYDTVLAALKEQQAKVSEELLGASDLEIRLRTMTEEREQFKPAAELRDTVASLEETKLIADKSLRDWQTRRDTARDAIQSADRRHDLELQLNQLDVKDGDTLEETTKQLDSETSQRDKLRDQLKSCDMRAEVAARLAKAEADLPDDIGDTDDTKKLHDRRATLATIISDIKERAALSEDLKGLPTDLAVEDLEERLAFVDKNLAIQKKDYREAFDEHKALSVQVEKFESGVCPTCKRPMNIEETKERHASLAKELRELHEAMKRPTQNLSKIRTDLAMAKKVADLQSKIDALPDGDLTEYKAERAQIKTRLAKLLAFQETTAEISTLREQLKGMPNENRDAIAHSLDAIECELPALKFTHAALQKAKLINEQIDDLPEGTKEQAEKDLAIADDAYNDLLSELEQLQVQLLEQGTCLTRREALDADIEEVETKFEVLSDLRHRQKVLGYAIAAVPKLKRRKLHKIVCAVRDVLPRYAGVMFSHEPNMSFVVDDDDSSGESMDLLARRLVEVFDHMEPVLIPVKGFSGGEKQRLSVALLFTLHSLLNPGKRPDILILDEVDKGLDERGVASLMLLVNEVKSQYGTVIMTSHRAQISGAKFDRVWEVTKENEVSSMKLTA